MAKKRTGHNINTKGRESWNVKESKIRQILENQQSRVDLDPIAFEALIKQKGVKVKVYRTTYCPKVKSVDAAEHEIDCDLCNGSGWIDLEPICTTAVIQNQALENLAMVEGMVDHNTVALTFPIGIELQYFTRIDLVDFTEIFFQRVKRTVGSDVDVLKFKACRVNIVIDYDGVRYYEAQDYKINQDGNIEWISGGRKPADKKIYSIHYESQVQFRATRALHVNRFSQVQTEKGIEFLKFQEQWMCTKEFLVRRKDVNGQDLQQGPYDDHEIVDEYE